MLLDEKLILFFANLHARQYNRHDKYLVSCPKHLEKSEVDLVLITLEVEDEAWLFILLARDGTMNRMGDGANSPEKESVHRGLTNEKLFKTELALNLG